MTTFRSGINKMCPNTELNVLNDDHYGEEGRRSNLLELTIADAPANTQTSKIETGYQEARKSSDQKNTKNGKGTKKSVCFSSRKRVRKIPPLSAMSQSMIANYWLSQEDFEMMTREYHYLLFFMERGDLENIDEESDSTRGLEYKTDEGIWKRYENRRQAYDMVLDEQERQRSIGGKQEYDAFSVAHLYRECSKSSIDDALEMAKQDEKAVQEYLSDVSTPCNNLGGVHNSGGRGIPHHTRPVCVAPSKENGVVRSALRKLQDSNELIIRTDPGGNNFTNQKWVQTLTTKGPRSKSLVAKEISYGRTRRL